MIMLTRGWESSAWFRLIRIVFFVFGRFDPTMDHRMAQIDGILDQKICFDPAADFEAFLRQAPAKWAVYLFADADDNPLQLLCVKNLRYSLKHRLQGETISLTKRIDYR